MNNSKSVQTNTFAEVITNLPEAVLPFEDARAWIMQGDRHQLIFFEMKPSVKVPEHSHNYAQWGMVIAGEMKLTISGKARTCTKGDEYVIPAQAKHSATFSRKTRVLDFFSEKARYKAKCI